MIKNLINQEFGRLTVLRLAGIGANKGALWECLCECGNVKIVRSSHLIEGNTKSCGCLAQENKETMNWCGYGEISRSYYTGLKNKALERNLEFTVSIEYLWELFLQQDRKCILTDLTLKFSRSKRKGKDFQTASLDRINSNYGYTQGNVQWVHKYINQMKWNIPQEDFIKMSILIARKYNND